MSYNPFFSVMLALGVAGRAAIGTDGRRVVTGATGMTVVKLASPVSALPPGDVRRGRVDGGNLSWSSRAQSVAAPRRASLPRAPPLLGTGMVRRSLRRFLPALEGVVAAAPARPGGRRHRRRFPCPCRLVPMVVVLG